MKFDLSYPEKNVALLSIEVQADRIEAARQTVYRQMASRYNVPGFRRGKAPLAIVQRYVGAAYFDQEVLDSLITEAYPEALSQANIEPVTRPELDITKWEPGEALVFTAKVTTKPEVTLGQYTGLEIEREEPAVSEEAVTEELESLRQAFGQMVDVPEDNPVEKGSIAVIDFTGYVEDKPFDGGAAQAYPLEIGSGSFVPGFEDGLLGAKVGEERDVNVTFPENYAGELGGKDVVFKVTVKGHKKRQLPEVDDEFARKAAPLAGLKADEEFNLEALRAEIHRRLLAAAERRIRADWEEKVLAKVAALAEMDVPAPMIDRATQARREEFEDMFKRSGTTLEQYMAEREMTEEQLRENMRPAAVETVRRELVLEAVGRKEGITASEQEVDERIKTYAQVRNEDVAELRQRLEANDGIDAIRDEITRRKVIEYLAEAQVPRAPVAAAPGVPEDTADSQSPEPAEPKAE